METLLLIYLIGALIGFGLAYSATSTKLFDPKETGMSRDKILTWAFFLSWLTILMCLLGFLKGIVKGVKNESDRD